MDTCYVCGCVIPLTALHLYVQWPDGHPDSVVDTIDCHMHLASMGYVAVGWLNYLKAHDLISESEGDETVHLDPIAS